ncbi:MAG: TetR/AcrR family transcriptional regulator [Solirubrobacterales bacterium]|nr:TetR/AcrR family transcriptional regulator [Solirubrobacterales bacterium]
MAATTKLQRELADPSAARRPTALDAFKLARRRFQDAERVDMSALAAELGVNRVTLYRWVGSRDQLLVEVIWSLADRTLERVDARIEAQGAERVVQLITGFLEAVIANPGMQRWLAEEGEAAMRLLTRREPGFQPRLIERVDAILREEAGAGRLDLPADLHEVAYVVVRLIESYTYLDLITGERPEARRAEPILRLLLRSQTA